MSDPQCNCIASYTSPHRRSRCALRKTGGEITKHATNAAASYVQVLAELEIHALQENILLEERGKQLLAEQERQRAIALAQLERAQHHEAYRAQMARQQAELDRVREANWLKEKDERARREAEFQYKK
ncbi:hypothetical protein EON65_38795 [archaeon]|nr:MAG: hypothetical protein EON65_38795 [archaeon]